MIFWTKEFCAEVNDVSTSGGGQSLLEQASAACTFFMGDDVGLTNPFLCKTVQNVRKSISRVISLVGHNKKKAGMCYATLGELIIDESQVHRTSLCSIT